MPALRPQDAGADAGADFFPHSPRVAFTRSQLKQAVCQLRFPTVLRIESTAPADFQERVRERLPFFERQQQGIGQLPPEIASIFGQGPAGSVAYNFRTEDNSTNLVLSPDSLSLTTSSYTRWEDFQDLLNIGTAALIDNYKPAFLTRVGLRYINVVSKKDLGLEGRSWVDLINNSILGEMSSSIFAAHVEEARRLLRLKNIDGTGGVLLQHGFNGADTSSYLIDIDFYSNEKTNAQDVRPLVDQFHTRAGHAFRWCLERPLFDALGPVPCD